MGFCTGRNLWLSRFRVCNLAPVPCRPMAGLISRWLPWAQIVAVQRCAPPSPAFLRCPICAVATPTVQQCSIGAHEGTAHGRL